MQGVPASGLALVTSTDTLAVQTLWGVGPRPAPLIYPTSPLSVLDSQHGNQNYKKKKSSRSRKTSDPEAGGQEQTIEEGRSVQEDQEARSKKAALPKRVPERVKTHRGKRAYAANANSVDSVVFEPKGLGARSGGQSGDLQGLSNRAGADSESVDELLEEGNAFEAEIVKGVEDAPDADEGEVRTHEVPEDDVPEEYLEKDE